MRELVFVLVFMLACLCLCVCVCWLCCYIGQHTCFVVNLNEQSVEIYNFNTDNNASRFRVVITLSWF